MLLPPVISNVSISNVTATSAVISWDTNKESDSLVKYGVSPTSYIQSQSNTNLITDHSLILEGLISDTQYYFVVNSTDIQGNSNQSVEYSFRTQNIDLIPPTTNLTLSGTLGNNSWYISDVQVNLTATDNVGGSGINKTEYTFDNSYLISFFK